MVSFRSQVSAALAAYEPTSDEIGQFAAMQQLAQSAADVLSPRWFAPGHFTVSGFVTDPALAAMVLIRHRRLDRWLQPGGHIEPVDATLVSALVREMKEETGLTDLAPEQPELFDVDVHTVPPYGGQPAHRHYDLRFHLMTRSADLGVSEDVDGAAWVALDDVEHWTDDQSVLRTVRKLCALRTRWLDSR